MRIDETGCNETIVSVDHHVGSGHRITRASDCANEPCRDRNPSTGEFATIGVDRRDESGIANQQIGSHRNESKISVTSATVVSGLTKQNRSIVSPSHELGTTKACPAMSSVELHA